MSSEIIINNYTYSFKAGETILDVARRNGVYIPTLCRLEGTVNTGACRVCLVEVEGARGLAASCAMPAEKGMVVYTDSPRVIEARRSVIAFLMISGNHNCAAGGIGAGDWSDFMARSADYDGSTELCDAYGRCELQELAYRYQVHEIIEETRLEAFQAKYSLEEANPNILRDFSRCILCGRCVKACNEIQVNNAISYGYRGTSAKIVTMGDRNLGTSACVFCGECVQACPVAALAEKHSRYRAPFWELEKTESTCMHCSRGCAIDVYSKGNEVLKIEGNSNGSNKGSLCRRGRYGFLYNNSPDRLGDFMVRKEGELQKASRKEAVSFTALRLKEIIDTHGAESVAAVVSPYSTLEDMYGIKKIVSSLGGIAVSTLSLIDGRYRFPGKGEFSKDVLSSVEENDCIVIAGLDVTKKSPVLASAVKRASFEKDVIVVDPRKTKITGFAHVHLQIKEGTDSVLFMGLACALHEMGMQCSDESRASFKGFYDGWDAVRVCGACGIEREDFNRAVEIIAHGEKPLFLYGNGLLQQREGGASIEYMKLCADCSGDTVNVLPVPAGANAAGLSLMETDTETIFGLFKKIEEGTVKALISAEGDLLEHLPEPKKGKALLEKLDFFAAGSLFLGETARLADAVFPGASYLERDGTTVGLDGTVHLLRESVGPPGEGEAFWKTMASIAQELDVDPGFSSVEEITGIVFSPEGPLGSVSMDEILQGSAVCTGKPARKGDNIGVNEIPVRDGAYPYHLISSFSVPFSYMELDGEGGDSSFCVVNPEDAKGIFIRSSGKIKIVTPAKTLEVKAKIDPSVPGGVIYISMHPADSKIRELFSFEGEEGIPAYKAYRARIE